MLHVCAAQFSCTVFIFSSDASHLSSLISSPGSFIPHLLHSLSIILLYSLSFHVAHHFHSSHLVFFYLHSSFSSRGLLGTLPPFLFPSFYFCYSLFCPICLVVLLPAVAAHSLDPAYVSIVTLTSSFLCLTSLNFSSFVSTSPSASPPWLVTMLHARECPITASLTLSALCLWPFALCTSNGRGVIHWLICWQPVWQGISFVSLPTMLLLSVCVSERESVNVSVSLCIWNMFVKLCVYVSVCVCCSMSTGHPSIKLIL